ncbi:MAG: CSLREA domain-containing protein, partial [Acidimicrobiia bacterium]
MTSWWQLRGWGYLLTLACLLFAASAGQPARAAGFTVDSVGDAVDANPGDGICATVARQCSLRAAVQETNAVLGGDTITLPPGEYAVLIPSLVDDEDTVAEGDLDITGDLEIEGAGAAATIIGANDLPAIRVFEVHDVATVRISNVTVQNGGHVFAHGGGIINYGTLTISDSVIRANEGREGGGIRNLGTLTVNGGAFIDNFGIIGHA